MGDYGDDPFSQLKTNYSTQLRTGDYNAKMGSKNWQHVALYLLTKTIYWLFLTNKKCWHFGFMKLTPGRGQFLKNYTLDEF